MDTQPNGVDIEDSARRKGKCRATPEEISETTPLLGTSQPLIQEFDPSANTRRRGRRLCILLATVFFTTLGLCLLIVLVLLVLTYSYQPKLSNAVRDEVLDRAVVIQGPDRVDVLNTTEGAVWLQVDMRVGVDAGTAIDVVLEANSNEGIDFGATAIQRTIGRWLVRRMKVVTVSVDEVSMASRHKLIANMTIPSLSVSLTLDRPEDLSWLTNFSFPMLVNVTNDTDDLAAIAQAAWRDGILLVEATLRNVSINGGKKDEHSWRQRVKLVQDIVTIQSRIAVPELPGLPFPGKDVPFPGLSDLVTLESYNISTANHNVCINATASVIDPLPASFDMRVPSIPFFVALSDTNKTSEIVTVTVGQTEPFTLTHPNITVHLTGTVPPLPLSSPPLLSSFLSSYLAGIDAPILVGTQLLPSLRLPALFPAPHPRPQLLRDMHIRNMKLNFLGENILASGTINALVVLPPGVNVLVDAQKIWPDVLVYDGEVPSIDTPHLRDVDVVYSKVHPKRVEHSTNEDRVRIPKDPLPDPLPERAFARIRPDDWLPAESEPTSDTNNAYKVTAQVVDVPLEVLPGRDHLLRSFISKVLFGGRNGALAGVNGTAAIAVAVDGLPVRDEKGKNESGHVFELTGLPFTGSVRVGRKSL